MKTTKTSLKTIKQISAKRGSYLKTGDKIKSASSDMQRVASRFKAENEAKKLRIFVAGGSRGGNDPVYEAESFKLGEKIAQMDFRLDFGLSGQGIMGAVAKGVLKVWAKKTNKDNLPISGITTKEYMAFTQKDEVVNQIKEVIIAHTLEERKNQLLNADFVMFAPGGIGTLDELVYDCVAMQDGFLPLKPFIIFNVNGHYYHILEYLKEIAMKGFSSPVPFIVVDDAFEADVVFKVLKKVYNIAHTREEIFQLVNDLIYHLPYILEQKKENPKRAVNTILMKLKKEKELLAVAIEKAYLKKEIDRMYGRLEKAGQDTALVSQKLSGLKKRTVSEKKEEYGIH